MTTTKFESKFHNKKTQPWQSNMFEGMSGFEGCNGQDLVS